MGDFALRLEHSVEADVMPAFAWRFRTDVGNWSDPPATFELDGPFAEGTRGTTQVPGQEPVNWRIGTVRPEERFAIEVPLDRAALTFEWRFEAISARRTRITQSILLSGENAAAYQAQVAAGFGATLEDGMNRIAAELVKAQRQTEGSG